MLNFANFSFRTCQLLLTVTLAGAVQAETINPENCTRLSFYTILSQSDGSVAIAHLPRVPNLPGQACYGWRAKVSLSKEVFRFKEVFSLPAAPETWGGEDDPYAANEITQDRMTSITEKFETPQNGSIGHEWCVAEGDPLGKYSMEVHVDDDFLGKIDFELVAPHDYDRMLSGE